MNPSIPRTIPSWWFPPLIALASCQLDTNPDGASTGNTVEASSIALGTRFGCAILSDRSVACFGRQAVGDVTPDEIPPRRVASIDDALAISVNWLTACVVRADASVWCWGAGDCASPVNNLPHAIAGISDVIDVGTTGMQTCALRRDGTVWCWGSNFNDTLGRPGASMDYSACFADPEQVPDLADVTQIAIDETHSCALRKDGKVLCWGGIWNQAPFFSSTPVLFDIPSQVKSIGVAMSSTIAITDDGSVYVWGYNGQGQLGLGTTTDVDVPTLVPNLNAAMATGRYRTLCVIQSDASVACAGDNGHGQLGSGMMGDPMTTFTSIPGVSGARALTTGDFGSCATRDDGTYVCWGIGPDDELHGPAPFEPTPQ